LKRESQDFPMQVNHCWVGKISPYKFWEEHKIQSKAKQNKIKKFQTLQEERKCKPEEINEKPKIERKLQLDNL